MTGWRKVQLPDCVHLGLDHTVRVWAPLPWTSLLDLTSTQDHHQGDIFDFISTNTLIIKMVQRLLMIYLPDDFLERASGAAHANHIFKFHPPEQANCLKFVAGKWYGDKNLFFWKWYGGRKPLSRRDFCSRMQNLYGIACNFFKGALRKGGTKESSGNVVPWYVKGEHLTAQDSTLQHNQGDSNTKRWKKQ